MPSKCAIGIDVGGTAIKAGLVTDSGKVLIRDGLATLTGEGPDAIIPQIAELVDRMKQGKAVDAVGVGMPGTLDVSNGIVHAAPNLPGWQEFPLVRTLSTAVGLPVTLENDANCAAIGEHACGAGAGLQHMVLLTLGTGVGGGMILGGRLWRGADGAAGEWGHTIVRIGGRRCNCGQSGCLEAYASASNTALRATEVVRSGRDSILGKVLDEHGSLTSQDVERAAQQGDSVAHEIWQETCEILAIACINIQHAVNPECVVLGGGMSAAGSVLLDGVRAAVERMGSRIVGKPPEVRLALLGNEAGFIGASINALTSI
jgi:glucokinase